MNAQELLLKTLRGILSKDISLNEELSKILNISYDAAHRRISLKSKFSIEETVILCQYYQISMDELFAHKEHLVIEKTKRIKTIDDFKDYFQKSGEILYQFKPEESTIYYSAKDIPVNYTVGGSLLSKFKLFVWYNLLTEREPFSFENFHIETAMMQKTQLLKTFFESSKRIEIWNDTTINSSLQQILYFFEAGLLSYTNACYLLEDLKEIITNIELKCQKQDSNFQLYYNELLILNNSVLVTSNEKSSFFVPYNILGYFVTHNKKIGKEEKQFLTNQLANSKNLNLSGKKDQKIFFNKMFQKIEFFKSKIDMYISE